VWQFSQGIPIRPWGFLLYRLISVWPDAGVGATRGGPSNTRAETSSKSFRMCTIHNQRGRYRERAHRLVMEGYCGWMSPTTGPAASFWPGHFPDILVSNPKPVSRRLPRLPTPECYSKPSEIEKLTDSLRYTLRFAQSRRELSATPLFFAIRALFFKSDRFCLDVIAMAGGFVNCDAI